MAYTKCTIPFPMNRKTVWCTDFENLITLRHDRFAVAAKQCAVLLRYLNSLVFSISSFLNICCVWILFFYQSGDESLAYLTCFEEEENETTNILSNKCADKSTNNTNCDESTKNIKTTEIGRRQQKPIYMQNDEVYI